MQFYAPQELSPKDEVKRRLRMVLVADRCGMSPASLSEMKKTIIKALQDFVDIEGEDGIEVSISNEPGLGTVYRFEVGGVWVRIKHSECLFTNVSLSHNLVTVVCGSLWNNASANSVQCCISWVPICKRSFTRSVNIPVKRVKAETRFEEPQVIETPDGVTLEWDPTDYNSDPSSRFPMGC